MTPIYKAVCKNFLLTYPFKKTVKVFAITALLFVALFGNYSEAIAQCACAARPVAIPGNISCAGSNSGTIDLLYYNATGNTCTLNFTWQIWSGTSAAPNTLLLSSTDTDPNTGLPFGPVTSFGPAPGINASLTNLAAGNYHIRTTDNNGCISNTGYTINEPSSIFSASITAFTNPTCNGGTTGSITVAGSGGSPGYSYAWSPDNEVTATISNKAIGTYTVIVSDASGCADTLTQTLTQPSAVSGTVAVFNACTGTSGGSATATPSGGSGAGYTYSWSNGQNTATATNLVAGNYTVTISDNVPCSSAPIPVTISNVPNPVAGITSTTPTDCGANTGTANGSVATSGTAPYRYSWSVIGGGPEIAPTSTYPFLNATNLSTGRYVLTVLDTNNCTDTAQAYVGFTNPPTVTASTTTPTICAGSTATLTATSSMAGSVFDWSVLGVSVGAGTPFDVTPLGTTTYTVTGTAPNGCFGTDTVVITINPIPTVTVTVNPVDQRVCAGDPVTLTANGASTYVWTRSTSPGSVTGTSITVNPLVTTTYSVIGTANGCSSAQVDKIVTVDPLPNVTANAVPPTICAGASSTLTGGGAVSYLWAPAGTGATASVIVTPATTTPYTVTGTDANGCVNTATTTVTVIPQPVVTPAATPSTICIGNSSDLSATSTIAGTTYAWTAPGGFAAAGTPVTVSPVATTTYTVTGTAAGCASAPVNVTVTVVADLPVDLTATNTSICAGTNTTLTASGATSYVWNPAVAGNPSSTIVSPAINTQYIVTGTTGACSDTASIWITVTPTLPVIITPSKNPICLGDNITLTASGATTYNWTDPVLSPSTNAVENVSPATLTTYTVTGTSGTCSANASVTITVNPVPSVNPALGAIQMEACLGTAKNLSPAVGPNVISTSGGTNPLVYAWTPTTGTDATGGLAPGDASSLNPAVTPTTTGVHTYTLLVTDANNCTATTNSQITVLSLPTVDAGTDQTICLNSSIAANLTATPAPAGAYTYGWVAAPGGAAGATASISVTPAVTTTYTVTATNGQGCFDTDDVIVIVDPALPVVGSSDFYTICNGTTVTLTGSGATTYSWVAAPGGAAGATASISVTPAATTTYTVTGTTGNCNNTDTVVITVKPLPTVTANPATVSTCVNTPVTLTAGGTAASYDWAPPTYLSATTGSSVVSTPTIATVTTYTVTGTLNGCTNTATSVVTSTANPNAPPVITATPNQFCASALPQSVAFTAATLGAGSTYSWVFGGCAAAGTSASATPNINYPGSCGTGVQNVDLTVTDGVTGCLMTATSTVTIDGTVGATTVNADQLNICGGQTSNLTANAAGATLYTWTAPAPFVTTTGATIAVTPTVTTTYTVTSSNGSCQTTNTITITVAGGVTAEAGNPRTICNGTAVILGGLGASTTGSGGTPGYTYVWTASGGAPAPGAVANPNITPAATTTYTVNVTDAVGCVGTDNVLITVNPIPTAATVGDFTICEGATKGIGGSPSTAAGGTAPYTYAWSPSGSISGSSTIANPIANATTTTTYTVIVTDANSCTATASMILTVNPSPTASAGGNVSTCNGAPTTLTSTVIGGTGPYTLDWSASLAPDPTDVANPVVNPTATTIYTLIATDANSCPDTSTVTVTVNPAIVADAGTDKTVCFGDNTILGGGTPATGGTSPYTYSWQASGGATVPASTANPVVNPTATTTYTLTVTDASSNSCTDVDSIILTVSPDISVSEVSHTDPNCNQSDGALTVAGAGGIGPFTYTWTPNVSVTASAVNIPSGAYKVVYQGAFGCKDSISVGLSDIGAPTANVSDSTMVLCYGFSTGGATIEVTNPGIGIGPYSYSWNSTPAQLTAIASNLPVGTYVGTITDDGNGCQGTDVVTITGPTDITTSVSSTTPVTCNGGSDGAIAIAAAGGAGGYTYAWNPAPGAGAGTASISGLTSQLYTVIVTDASGCADTTTATPGTPSAVTATSVQTNISCFAAADGSITVSGSGGTAPLSYSWSPIINSTPIASNLDTGSYIVTVTDANLCIFKDTIAITQPMVLTATTSTINSSCGFSDGSATVAPLGGTAPYSYLWNSAPPQFTAVAANLTSGIYSVTVTDNNGCQVTKTDTVNSTVTTLVSITKNNDQNCFGINDGSATAVATNGAAPYTYTWDALPASVNGTITTLSPGKHRVMVTDKNFCQTSGIDSVVINAATPIVTDTTTTPVSCSVTNGTATVTVSGGTGPYTYLWDDGSSQTTATAIGLAAGTYIVTETDALGCIQKDTAIVKNSLILSAANTPTDASCFGGGDGSAIVTPTGGIGPYSYSWPNSVSTTATATNLSAGNYTVTVTDANAPACTATTTVVIGQASTITFATSSVSPTTCAGSDGSATVTPAGGNGGYTHLWNTIPTGQTTPTATGLSAGAYKDVVTDSKGCKDSVTVGVSNLTGPTVSMGSIQPASCSNTCDGEATATAVGAAPLSYTWVTSAQSTATVTDLCEGSHTVAVTDGAGCTTTSSVTINAPGAISVTITGSNVPCQAGNNGSATAVVTGGTAPYSHTWKNSLGTNIGSGLSITGLSAGTYTLNSVDANGCLGVGTIIITEPATAVTSSKTSQTNLACNGDCSIGAATVAGSGGGGSYTYSWNTSPNQLSATATALCAGTYIATVTDGAGCSDTTMVTIIEPAGLTITEVVTDASCNASNGKIDLTIGGGTAPYTVSWNPPNAGTTNLINLAAGTYIATVTDAGLTCSQQKTIIVSNSSGPTIATSTTSPSCVGSSDGTATATVTGDAPFTYSWATSPLAQVTATATGLNAGDYTITVTDNKGCIKSDTATVTDPSPVVVNVISNPVNCNSGSDGSATATASGGSGPYTYSWSHGPATAAVSGLAIGSFTVTATDAKGCTGSSTITITSPTSLTIDGISQVNVTCFGGNNGSATVAVSGGTAPYSYLWSSGSTGTIASGLTAGTYVVTVTDANGCQATGSVTITENTAIIATVTINSGITCNAACDGSLIVNASGGTGGFGYSWNTNPVQTTQIASGLCAGISYSVTVTDAAGCLSTSTPTTLTEPAVLTLATSSTNADCGVANGTATVTPAGGNGGYIHAWDINAAGQITPTATALAAGFYEDIVTDSKGCKDSVTVGVSNPNGPVVSTSASTNATCNGTCDGTATVSVSPLSPNGPFTFTWSSPVKTDLNATSSSNTGLCAGNVVVNVTNTASCITAYTVVITEPLALSINVTPTDVKCNGGNDGSAIAVVAGGTGPYTYVWSGGGGNAATASNLAAGSYTVDVTDFNGCTLPPAAVTIAEPSVLSVTTSQTITQNCSGSCTNTATVVATGGTAPYSYSWDTSPVQTTPTATGLCAGTYTVTVTDANGCITTGTETITLPPAILLSTTVQNATCNAANGIASVLASGGTAPYAYLWAGGVANPTNDTIFNLLAASYNVTVTDFSGCSVTAIANVSNQNGPQITTSTVNPTCNGGSDGMVIVTPVRAGAIYTYLWSDPLAQTNDTASGLNAGIYAVTADSAGCKTVVSDTLVDPTKVLVGMTFTNVSCNGGSDGKATAAASGGTGPYTYLWAHGTNPVTPAISGLPAATYTVTATDVFSCTAVQPVTITDPASLSIDNFVSVDATCNGGSDGSATASVSGGTAPYSYVWTSSPSTGAIASGLKAGNYILTVTDAQGCSISDTVTINEPTIILTPVTETVPISCNATCNGSLTVNPTGGSGTYTYSWNSSPVQNSQTAVSLCAGVSYSVTVTDSKGCIAVSIADTLTAPGALTLTTTTINAQCGIADGSATVIPSGGTQPYTFSWKPAPPPGAGNTTATYSNILAGPYTVDVTDANGCFKSTSVGVNNPNGPVVNVLSSVNATCTGICDGSITVSAVGAVSYDWSSPGNPTTPAVTGLCAGDHTVAAEDINKCVGTKTITITEPSAILINLTSTNVTCNGLNNGTATAVVTGGTPPYTYSWDDGSNQKTASADNLAPGTYKVIVRDLNGCTATSASVLITEPTGLSVSVSTSTALVCAGSCNNAATVTVTGGSMPYSYSWNTSPQQFTQTATGLCDGTFIATVTDANGCSTEATATISLPSTIVLTTTTKNASCNIANGEASVSASGGVSPYKYLWNVVDKPTNDTIFNLSAASYFVTVTDSNGCTATATANVSNTNGPQITTTAFSPKCPGGTDGKLIVSPLIPGNTYTYFWNDSMTQANDTASGLRAGIYSVTATDSLGCITVLGDTIVDPASITVFTSTKNVSCNGGNDGSATATAANGAAPYIYNWSKAGSLAGPTVSGLTEGTYTVNVTDKNGCTVNNSIVITAPNPLTIATSQTNITCFGGNDGTATATASSGTAPYTYSWSPSGGTGNAAFGLIANTKYTIAVTDAKGCIVTKDVTLTQPPAIVPILTEVASITCNAKCDGSLSVNASGGSGIYTYSWNTVPAQTTQTAVNLCSGTYTVTTKDAAGCTSIGTKVIAEPLPLTLVASSTNAQCAASDGTASVTVTGGKPGYTYAWSSTPPAIPVQNTATATGLAAGAYTVTVKDTNGCTASTNIGVNNPNGPTVTLVSSSNIKCSGVFCDGTATVSASGANTPFTYLWTNGSTSLAATGLCANPVVIVTDKAGCKGTLTVPLTAPTPIQIDLSFTDITCNNGNNGTATATVSGGTAPYTYLWSNGQTSAKAINLAAGIYDLVVTDANKCTQTSAKVTIKNPAAVSATLTVNGTIQCYGQCNSSITTVVSGGLAPYTYVWDTSPIQFTSTATGLCAGTYTVKITDANGCEITKSTSIAQPADMVLSLTHTDIACNVATGTASVTVVSGGILPATYLWSTLDTSASISNKPAGNYTVEVTDLNGCKKDTTVGISNIGGPVATVTATDATCIGSCNGTATVAVANGTIPYTYSWNDVNGQITPTANNLCAGTYVVTVTDSNGCIGVGNPVNVAKPAITVSANPTTGCQGTVVALTGTAPATGTISWSSTLLPKGTFNPANNINSSYTTNSAGSDTLTMTWQSTDLTCTPYTQSFVINITATPVANPVLPIGMNCQNIPITLTGSTASGGVISWAATNPAGPTGSFNNISIAAPTYTPSAGELGTTTLTMTVDNGICKTTNTVNIVWTPDVVPVAGLDKTICINEALQLNPTITGSVTGIIWSTSGDGTFSPNNTTASAIYTHGTTDLANASVVLSITTTGGCGSKSASMTVSIKPSATISAGPDQTIVLGKSAQLKGTLIGASSVVWTTNGCGTLSSANSLTPIYKPCTEDRKDTIIFYITSNDGCKTVIDSMYLKIRETNFVDVFTPYPTSPGYNDVFVLPNLPDNARLVVFNRWGLKVFEAENYKNDWDGEGLPSDTYYYNLEVPGFPVGHGFVTIFREE